MFCAAEFGQSAFSSKSNNPMTMQDYLQTTFGFVRWRRILLETEVVFFMQFFGIFKQMILQNMLDAIVLVDLDTFF
jgi:hypothetical protein